MEALLGNYPVRCSQHGGGQCCDVHKDDCQELVVFTFRQFRLDWAIRITAISLALVSIDSYDIVCHSFKL